jgi:hypothetical protein
MRRLRYQGSAVSFAAPALVVLASLVLIWGGVVVLLLALKVEPATVDSITGYSAVYDALRDLGPANFDATGRAITAGAGVGLFLVCGYLAYRMLPRPYLTGGELSLIGHDQGETRISTRAIERLGETASERRPGISSASGRYGTDELAVKVTVGRSRDLRFALEDVRNAVRHALDEHGLPVVAVNVTVTGYRQQPERELH